MNCDISDIYSTTFRKLVNKNILAVYTEMFSVLHSRGPKTFSHIYDLDKSITTLIFCRTLIHGTISRNKHFLTLLNFIAVKYWPKMIILAPPVCCKMLIQPRICCTHPIQADRIHTVNCAIWQNCHRLVVAFHCYESVS